LEKVIMSLFKESIQDHLTEAPVDRLARASYPGMAHFARTGPVNSTCRECLFWQHGPHDYRAKNGKWRGLIEAATCKKYRMITLQEGAKVPDDAPACKYFDLNPSPPGRFSK
jgi:hypothetical protein